ncbi:glycosyltransferase [Celeribacter halophilus]|uniref:glycosyltransferase n=1 Tax=Celeribacter halophilus TaxID=576117 RepID=UPI0026E2ECB3|nr:glycosyltransferase [Celeribacter halophilus]MDO6724798.1 glycosyltransferase [Celeribacter halophilus]
MNASSSIKEAPPSITNANVGIVHDWLPVVSGAERVLQQMVAAFPNSEVYTLFDFLTEKERREIVGLSPVHVSRLNALPGVRKYYRYLLLSCTRAIEEFDVTNHEIIISSSAALAKGVLTSPEQKHFAYVHSPARYAWDLTHEYINGIDGVAAGLKQMLARQMMHKFRLWDMRTSPSVDHFIANSEFIKKRIWKVYRRDADVIYPPVNTDGFNLPAEPRQEHFLVASRMVPYKRIPMIVEAFARRPDLKLHVVGDGPEMPAVRAAAGTNVEILGHVPFSELKRQMQTARAFVFAAKEDFGIVPVEAQACGTPVIALGQGGTAETVRSLERKNPTGVWFEEQTIDSFLAALDRFIVEESAFTPENCRQNALAFSEEKFRKQLSSYVMDRTGKIHET